MCEIMKKILTVGISSCGKKCPHVCNWCQGVRKILSRPSRPSYENSDTPIPTIHLFSEGQCPQEHIWELWIIYGDYLFFYRHMYRICPVRHTFLSITNVAVTQVLYLSSCMHIDMHQYSGINEHGPLGWKVLPKFKPKVYFLAEIWALPCDMSGGMGFQHSTCGLPPLFLGILDDPVSIGK